MRWKLTEARRYTNLYPSSSSSSAFLGWTSSGFTIDTFNASPNGSLPSMPPQSVSKTNLAAAFPSLCPRTNEAPDLCAADKDDACTGDMAESLIACVNNGRATSSLRLLRKVNCWLGRPGQPGLSSSIPRHGRFPFRSANRPLPIVILTRWCWRFWRLIRRLLCQGWVREADENWQET